MSRQHIPSITIQGFRGIRDLQLTRLEQVNLISGSNSAGKTSVLEAIHLYAEMGSPEVLGEVLGAYTEPTREPHRRAETKSDLLAATAMFQGFPQLEQYIEPIRITTGRREPPHIVQIELKVLTIATDDQGVRRLNEHLPNPAIDPQEVLTLVVNSEEWTQNHPLNQIFQAMRRDPGIPLGRHNRKEPASTLVGPHYKRAPHLWDQVALTEKEEPVIEALRILESRITAFSMIGDDQPGEARNLAVRMTGKPGPILLRTLGEGINRIYDTMLATASIPGGTVLIDQIGEGLAPGAQLELWRTLFRLARNHDIQVFATTHNAETIQAFQKASGESPWTPSISI